MRCRDVLGCGVVINKYKVIAHTVPSKSIGKVKTVLELLAVESIH